MGSIPRDYRNFSLLVSLHLECPRSDVFERLQLLTSADSTPWILTFVLAVLIKLTEKNSVKEEVTGSENAENSPERAPLLPAQIPGPKLPSQRMAVQRYPS